MSDERSRPRPGHWFAEHLRVLERMAREAGEASDDASEEWQRYHALLAELLDTARDIGEADPVTACVVGQQGVSLGSYGDPDYSVAVAALADDCVALGQRIADPLDLGELRQIVFVGEQAKLALFHLGSVHFSVLAPADVVLGRFLARRMATPDSNPEPRR